MREMQSPRRRLLLQPRRRLRARGGQVLRLVAGGGARRCSTRTSMRSLPAVYGLDQTAQLRGAALASAHRPAAGAGGRAARVARADRAGRCSTRARRKLFAAREQRVRPGRDEKILTVLERADDPRHGCMPAACLDRPRVDRLRAARARLPARTSCGGTRRLLATFKDGRAHLNAYLDDHAFLLAALLESCRRTSGAPISTSPSRLPTCCSSAVRGSGGTADFSSPATTTSS